MPQHVARCPVHACNPSYMEVRVNMLPIFSGSLKQGGSTTEPEYSSEPRMMGLSSRHNILLSGQYLDKISGSLKFYAFCILNTDFSVTLRVTPVLLQNETPWHPGKLTNIRQDPCYLGKMRI
jgi:hypothetical protein